MRILHFSDFHLNGEKISDAKHTLNFMLKAIKKIQNERAIDLVVFSGDMLERGGEGYEKDLKAAFTSFKEVVINPIMAELGIPLSRFIFAPGNHDIDRDVDDEMMEDGIEKHTKDYNGIVNFAKNPKIAKYTARINSFKEFEEDFYKDLDNVLYNGSRFVSTFEYDIDGITVGVSALNNVWRCSCNDKDKIALGIHQIAEYTRHLEGKSIRLAVMHYPIEYLKETERHIVMELCARNFDVVFCGHSHQGYVNMQAPLSNRAFLEVNTSGTLAANTYVNDSKYRNSFQIVDCEVGVQYAVRKYYQSDFQDFILDVNNDYPDGNNIRHYPNPYQLEVLYKTYIDALHRDEELRITHAISPFVLLDEFINRPNNVVMKSNFVRSARIDELMEEIKSGTKDYRLIALSGMGKTRIVAETFKGVPGVYYSHTDNCVNGVCEVLRLKDPTVIIVDNCCNYSMREIQKKIDESGKNVRLITIHNVPTPNEQSTRGQLRLLDYNDTKDVVESMLAAEPSIQDNQYLIAAIRERSGNIPYMTVLLLEAYRKNNTLSIDNADDILRAILSGNENPEKNIENALKAISLFDPLGYELDIREEYEFVTKNDKIHHIPLNQDVVNRVFIDVINDYHKRQLIEKDGWSIRLRPRPLAEWLTESWLIEYGNDMPNIIDEIASLEENLSKRLFRALNNRFKQMSNSLNAKKVFDIINNPVNGSFHNERIAFSKSGSQLFLSMGLVSPVMVAKNLWGLIDSKSIEWLRTDMNPDARRNLVWALENICADSNAFLDGAKCLAKLSVAENEDISNNATRQFLQLFHLYLSGTKADLKMRISLIQSLRENEIYLPLLIKAIGSAFVSDGFYRANTSGVLRYQETPDDYYPLIGEIKKYWYDCADVLKYITEQNPDLLPMAIELLPKHVGDFARIHELPLLFSLVEYYGKSIDYEWPEMRDNLSMCHQYWFQGSEELRGELIKWLQIMAPKTLLGRIKASLKDERHKIDDNLEVYKQKMIGQMLPFAEEFINRKLYNTKEFDDIVLDDQLRTYWFVTCVAKITNDKGLAKDILISILKIVLDQPESFECEFIPSFICQIYDMEAIEYFKRELLTHKRFNQYSSIVGALDQESYALLQELIDGYKSGIFDNHCINNYLRYYKCYTIHNILAIFDVLHDAGVSSKEVCYPFIMNHLRYHINKDDKTVFEKYKSILLGYDFDDSYLSSEIVDAIIDILKFGDEHEFAKAIHVKVVQYICSPGSRSNSFEQLYFALLPQYQDEILDDLCEVLSSEDERMMFYYKMYNYLGSGFGLGAGPLFQCDWEILKGACMRHPSVLPQRFAQMCPVYKYSDNESVQGFSDFFLWLCDNFGDQKQVLESFSSNMGTYSWSGVNGFSNFIEKRIPCLKQLLEHRSSIVTEWATLELELIQKEVTQEKGKEAYERMVRG